MIISISKSTGECHSFHKNFKTVEVKTLRDFFQAITTTHWSGILWKDGARAKANFESARLCVLDFDEGPSLESIHKWAKDHAYFFVIATTKSHQKPKGDRPPCDRFRLVLKFSEEITCVKHYEQNMRRIAKLVHSDISCCDGGRKFAPSTQIVAYENGNTLPVAIYKTPRSQYDNRYIRSKIMPPWIRQLLTTGCEQGRRNTSCFRLGANLYALGYSENEVINLVVGSAIDLPEEEKRNAARSGISRARADGVKGC